MRVVADFTVRGNIKTIIFAEHSSPDYQGPRPEFRRRKRHRLRLHRMLHRLQRHAATLQSSTPVMAATIMVKL